MNSFTILQSEKQTKLAVSLHSNAEISAVRLSRTKATADRPEETLKGPITVSMDVRAKHIAQVSASLLIEVSFRLTGASSDGRTKSRSAICVECAFEVEYHLRHGFTPTDEQIKAFKDGNAIFNCWPYCRQHVQDMLLRMGYPPPTLPFLRVQTGVRKPVKDARLKQNAVTSKSMAKKH